MVISHAVKGSEVTAENNLAIGLDSDGMNSGVAAGHPLPDIKIGIYRALITRRIRRCVQTSDSTARNAVIISEIAADVIGENGRLVGHRRRQIGAGEGKDRAIGPGTRIKCFIQGTIQIQPGNASPVDLINLRKVARNDNGPVGLAGTGRLAQDLKDAAVSASLVEKKTAVKRAGGEEPGHIIERVLIEESKGAPGQYAAIRLQSHRVNNIVKSSPDRRCQIDGTGRTQ